ncbi:molybdenum cofactor guanylyltransferase [Paenibacillus xerothermodurans]|uniref:molybdenum cofactor guanylyltransferase n=1 Tax=Paenibacillus xerothermodurans TaxID=1977292 RepID=UPI00140285DA|nr:molybdenum cofactor guanylyltransferase [Paenibacillus xerothermodurans]
MTSVSRQQITGVVLAGGLNRRMGGRLKALLELNGQAFIHRQLDEMSKLCGEVVIVTNQPELFALECRQLKERRLDARFVRDLHPGKGPLAGLQAAMAAADHDNLWVVACDMPYISAAAAALLHEVRSAHDHDAAVPVLRGRLQPLHAMYHRRSRGIIDKLLDQGQYKMTGLLEQLDYARVEDRVLEQRGIRTGFAENVNTPEDLELLQNHKGCGGSL